MRSASSTPTPSSPFRRAASPLQSVAVGCWRCRRGGSGTAEQGIEPGVQRCQPLVFALDLLDFSRSVELFCRPARCRSADARSRLRAVSNAIRSRERVRQFSINKNERHRGSDEAYGPFPRKLDGVAGEGDAIIRRRRRRSGRGQGLRWPGCSQGGPGLAQGSFKFRLNSVFAWALASPAVPKDP